jgi:hypothetical protein
MAIGATAPALQAGERFFQARFADRIRGSHNRIAATFIDINAPRPTIRARVYAALQHNDAGIEAMTSKCSLIQDRIRIDYDD